MAQSIEPPKKQMNSVQFSVPPPLVNHSHPAPVLPTISTESRLVNTHKAVKSLCDSVTNLDHNASYTGCLGDNEASTTTHDVYMIQQEQRLWIQMI